MKNTFASVLLAGCLVAVVVSECPNACSAHGKCGAYDMCTCYRNWMSNDCSERVCQFGLAHVDTPKGDLDSSSGKLSDADTIVIENDAMYPYGTTEQYPFVGDIDGNVIENTAHEYRECSNKGICDRETGTCACFEGYDGSACQRASCPITDGAMCAGHGTCHTIEELAKMDSGNIYELWDADSTMGCKCDPGYTGADCSQKLCKYGNDPLYFDSGATARYSNWTYQFYTQTVNSATIEGNYSIIFYDAHGEDWQTEPIDYDASCVTIVNALENLPNNVIPTNSVRCFKNDIFTGNGQDSASDPISDALMTVHNRYTLAFPGNPGALKQIEITKYLDGARPTLFSDETISTLGWHIYANGFSGEDVDMVPDECEGVLVTLAIDSTDSTTSVLDSLTADETKLLKKCLGSSDSTDDNNVEVYNWDYGNNFNPHLIKLVDQTQYTSTVMGTYPDTNIDYELGMVPPSVLCNPNDINPELLGADRCANRNPPGFFAVLYYDAGIAAIGSESPFRLYTAAANDYHVSTQFKVYTTKGYLQLVNPNAAVFTEIDGTYSDKQKIDSFYTRTLQVTNTTGEATYNDWMGWMDCETQTIGTNGNLACLNKNDKVMFLAYNNSDAIYPNIYTVEKLNRAEKSWLNEPQIAYGIGAIPRNLGLDSDKIRTTITVDKGTNQRMIYKTGIWGTGNAADNTIARVYKFYADTTTPSGGYAYAGECSHRGVCNRDNGQCECFGGYTNDNCNSINALAA